MGLFQRTSQSKVTAHSRPVSNSFRFPNNVILKSGIGYYYYKNGKRWSLASQRIIDSWCLTVYNVDHQDIKSIPLVGKLGFRDGSLLRNEADGTIYLVENNRRRHIQTPDFFTRLGVDRDEVLRVSQDELQYQALGEPIK